MGNALVPVTLLSHDPDGSWDHITPLLGSYFDLSWEPNMVHVQGALVYIFCLSPGDSL